jgi:hypothetical protein
VLGFAHATIVEDACVHVPVTDAMIGTNGAIADADARGRVADALTTLASAL